MLFHNFFLLLAASGVSHALFEEAQAQCMCPCACSLPAATGTMSVVPKATSSMVKQPMSTVAPKGPGSGFGTGTGTGAGAGAGAGAGSGSGSASGNFMSSQTVVQNINVVTTLSRNLQGVVKDIQTPFNIPAAGPQLVSGFAQIGQSVAADLAAMSSNPLGKYDVAGQTSICDAFRDFVYVHQDLLKLIIGKKSVFASAAFTAPVAAALRGIEGGVDTLAFGLINAVPTCASQAMANKAALDQTLMVSITTYSS